MNLPFFIPALVTITTQRLRLREFNLGDAAAVFEYGRRMEVARYAGWGPYETLEEVEHLMERFTRWQFETPRRRLVLAVTLAEGGRVIGDIGLSTRQEEAAEAELGYALHPDYWGQGLASEAAVAMVDYGFRVVGWQRIFATCYLENEASAAVLRKIGLRQERILRQHAQRHGRWYDSLLFALFRSEWEISHALPR
jgi:RimJ/RimL family protein N-acetyltransferase